MISHLQYLFLPHSSNNHKPKILHLSSLTILLLLIAIFQTGLSLITKIKPGILGYASSIDPQRLIELTNQKRAESGLTSLQFNAVLAQEAQQKAGCMFTFNSWAHDCNGHTPWSFFKDAGYEYLYAGENLAKDFNDSDAVVNAWMNSPTHRDNILNSKYKEIGIAVVNGMLNGVETTLVVQSFGTPSRTPAIAYVAPQQTVKTAQIQVSPAPAKPKPSASLSVEQEINKQATLAANLQEAKNLSPMSSFTVTRTFYLILVSLLIIILSLDGIIIAKNNIVRISGKSFIHLSFFIIILISILLAYPGQII